MTSWLQRGDGRRALVVGVVCSLVLHGLLVALLIVAGSFSPPVFIKRGEPLLVDITPELPKEPAPLGNPAEPPSPARPSPPPAPRVVEKPAPPPRVAEALPPRPRPSPPPRVEVEPRLPEPKPQEPRAPEPRVAEPKPPEPRVAEPKAPEPKAPEPRVAEPKAPEPKAPEPRVAAALPPEPPAPEPTPPPSLPERLPQVAKAPVAPAPVATPPPPPAEPPAPPVASPPAAPAPEAPPARAAEPGPPAPSSGQGLAGESRGRFALAKPSLDLPPSMLRPPGGGLRGGRGGVEGEPIPLDTPEPKYQDYFNKIREQIKSKWIYPRDAGERGIGGELLIEFHIAKDGRLQHLELRRSSGEEILDRFAMNAVRLAQPFPPVPDQLAKQVLAISGLFRYQIVGIDLLNQFIR